MSSVSHLLYHLIERIMSDAPEEHESKVKCSMDGRTVTNLRFADDTDAFADEER